MKKIYTLFICMFLFAGISAFAQSSEEMDALAKRKTLEISSTLDLNQTQKLQLLTVVKKYEENKLDYAGVAESAYPYSKFSIMREKYASDILPEIKEILTTAQFETFSQYLQPN